MSSETPAGRERNMIWVIPVVAVVLLLLFNLFNLWMIGPNRPQEIDLWSTDFVPAESVYAIGEHSR